MSSIDNVVGAVTPPESNEARTEARAKSRGKSPKELTLIRTGHSVAKEAALYPALAQADEEGHATMAYTEQSVAKLEIGLLEDLPPMSQEFLDKFVHIKGAVAHHEYEEEGIGFWI
jgi:hypothetical protein